MPQNKESGAIAAKFGREAAISIAKSIGATKLTNNSNEFELHGKRITIRMARLKNHQIGVLYSMLDRVDTIIGAFEVSVNQFQLISLCPKEFRSAMRDSKTGGGRVGLVTKKVFVERGSNVASVTIELPISM